MNKQSGLRIAAAALAMMMIVSALFFALRSIILDEGYFLSVYSRLNNATRMGMSTDDLVRATMRMTYYMEGRVEDINVEVDINGTKTQMFNDRERAHMVDVRVLYQNIRLVCVVSALLFFVAFIAFRKKISFALALLQGGAAFLAIILIIGIWAAIDFSSFWVAFHHLFFTNDLWLLDPSTSRMINMMPETLFSSIVKSLLIRFSLVYVAIMSAALTWRKHEKKKEGETA